MKHISAPRRRRGFRTALLFAVSILSFAFSASTAWADSPTPSSLTQVSLTVNPVDGSKTLTVQGTWDWGANGPCDSTNDKKAVGYAVDWNDVNQPGNLVASGVDVGTPTDNLVRPANNTSFVVCTTNSGAFGPLSHTYSATTPLPSTVCAVTYDVHIGKEGQIATSGNHSTKAGGSNHNTDNSLEEPFTGVATCASLGGFSAVQFRGFTASATKKGVQLRWKTASEVDTLGFNVYRDVKGKRVKVNRSLIASASIGGTAGHSYSFLDRLGLKAKAPRYWLQVVDLDGKRTWHGPARVGSARS